MKILITGSSGFIGKKLVSKLRQRNHFVTEFSAGKGVDIRNSEQIMNAVKGNEIVIHLAAVLDEKSKELNEVNVQGTKNVCIACEKNHARLIFLSTAGVMGNIEGEATEVNGMNPVTKYEKSKAEAEKIVQSFQETTEIMIIRSALVLGANDYWKKIIALVKKGFPLIGSGENIFQTIYVDELVQAISFLLERVHESGEVFIVSEKQKHSLKQIIEMIQEELGMEKKVKSIPKIAGKALGLITGNSLLKGEYIERLNRNRNYSIKKLESLGWKPMYSTRAA
ncbi:MAG: NAD-dependent epimerase/dehydratase family protein, partial [Candidatus Diapherotrites archaeon]|nr:NAD-dependent epimerase/dehydratase family protein [Candidatus Diapherotrites archaeon]